jgi:uncharacterized protein UPF0182
VAAGVLALLLVAGRWLAVETAERAWAATLPVGSVYLVTRSLARLVGLAVWLIAAVWGTGNLYIVYRAIGSVQMPRRVGNLEIVEAVPQRLLLVLAIASGLVFGIGLAWGKGDWWRELLLATGAPHFGRVDPILHRDLGEYLGGLPWALERQGFLMLSTVTAVVLVTFLYVGMGSLRWQGGRLIASSHARVHVGVLLCGVALATLWGALLDPAEVVAGLHGPLTDGLVTMRIPASGAVAIAAGVAAIASLAWAGWDRIRWLAVGWGLALSAEIVVYGILPAFGRTPVSLASERAELTALAFGTDRQSGSTLGEYPSVAALASAAPLWTAPFVAATVRSSLESDEAVAGVSLWHRPDGLPEWIVARAPDDSSLSSQPELAWETVHRERRARAGAPLGFVENDSGLGAAALDVRDSVQWFGEGFTQYAVVSGETPDGMGIPLTGGWRRVALAWVLQSPEVARRTTPDDHLLWRRTATERLKLLAPFAQFTKPEPVMVNGVLWWRAVGYVSSSTFPLVDTQHLPQGSVRYHRAGLLSAVRATTGETRFWLLPGADSLTAAWARLFFPLVAPAENLPRSLAASLRFPAATFDLAVHSIQAAATPPDSGWRTLNRDPWELASPVDGTPWLVQGFTSNQGRRVEGFLVGSVEAGRPQLVYVASSGEEPPPQPLVGAGDTVPELPHFWMAAGHLASAQARFIKPKVVGAVPVLQRVFVTWGNRAGDGATRSAALRDLASAGAPGSADTSLAARWERAGRLFAQLDSTLRLRDFEAFGRVYRQLGELLAPRRRVLAPATPPR